MQKHIKYYRDIIEDYRDRLNGHPFSQKDLLLYQELQYRLCVLESFRFWLNAAPLTTDLRILRSHYQVVNAYMDVLVQERRHDFVAEKEYREKSVQVLLTMTATIHEWRLRFERFCPEDEKSYRTQLNQYVSEVLSLWMAYRSRYLDIPEEQLRQENG